MASSTYPFDPEGMKDRCILGCTILALTAVVFVVIVSGMTTMLANRNFPQLEVFSDWPNGGIIPRQYGCHAEDGKPQSIPLHWRNVPRSATNLAILFAHPGSLSENGFDPVHWFVTDVPLNTGGKSSITANASANPALMPVGAKQYRSAYSTRTGYWPPCVQNGTSLFAVHIYAIDASPTIGNFRDAREIMNRFVGVPVARITGVYGEPSPLHIPTGKGQTGWNPDDDDDDGGASQNGDLSNNSDGKDGHESGHGDHGHNSDEKNGHEPGHIHGVHNGDGKEIHEPGHVHGEPGHNDGKGGHEHEHSDGGSTSKGDHGHTVDKDHSAEHQEHEGAGDGHKSAEDGHEENGDGSKEDHAEENTDGAQEEKTTDKKSPTTENAS